MFFVYVIWNGSRFYVGQTHDLETRVAQHNDPKNTFSKFTKRYPGPWELVHQEEFPSRKEAMAREKQLKSGQGRAWLKANVLPEQKEDG